MHDLSVSLYNTKLIFYPTNYIKSTLFRPSSGRIPILHSSIMLLNVTMVNSSCPFLNAIMHLDPMRREESRTSRREKHAFCSKMREELDLWMLEIHS